jgi:hypothetical protein
MFESKTLGLGYTLTTDSIPEKGMPSVDVHLQAAIDWSGLLCCPEGWRQNARHLGWVRTLDRQWVLSRPQYRRWHSRILPRSMLDISHGHT